MYCLTYKLYVANTKYETGWTMGLPLHLSIKLGTHLMKMKLRGVEKFPMIVEVEPLFACNLKCVGCGKIQHPASELKRRMPVEQAVAAVQECGAPMVSLAGGEPLMHPQIHEMVNELVKRHKFVVLCTNAVLLPKHLHKFTPSKNFAWMVHIDGLRERHDESVSKEGVFDQAVAAIKLAKAAGFQVYTNSTFFNTDSPQAVIDVLNYPTTSSRWTGWRSPPATPMRRPRPRTGSWAWSRPASCSGPPSPRAAGRSGG
jgi:hopanoid biosynthesis associated radical SAM protein HpnH